MKDNMKNENSASHYTKYRRTYRHIDYHLKKSLDVRRGYSIDEMREALFDETGFRFTRMTMKKLIKKFQKSHGISPIEQVYRLNDGYFNQFESKVRPSKIYKKRQKIQNEC